MEMKEIESAVEGILFASGEPVQTDRICVALEMDRPTVEQVLQKLMDYYAYERRGIRLLRMEDTWQLCSAPDYADVIRKAFEIRKPAKLSQPALEVLTSSPTTSPPPGPMWTRSGAWTAPIPSACCWTGSSSRSAAACRYPEGPACTGPPNSFSGPSI